MRSDLVFLVLVLSVVSIHPIAGFAESNAAQVEIKDIHWEMGPPMPWPTKGQAQVVIGETIVAAGSPDIQAGFRARSIPPARDGSSAREASTSMDGSSIPAA